MLGRPGFALDRAYARLFGYMYHVGMLALGVITNLRPQLAIASGFPLQCDIDLNVCYGTGGSKRVWAHAVPSCN